MHIHTRDRARHAIGLVAAHVRAQILRALPDPVVRSIEHWHYGRHLGAWVDAGEPEFVLVRALVRPGDAVLDIGANVGVYTILLSRLVGPSGRVTSVEPVPRTFALLASMVERSGADNVRLARCAASDASGCADMLVPHWESGAENYYQARIDTTAGAPGQRRVKVETRRVDDLVPVDEPIAFVKVDVEGHELPALRGAMGMLRRHRPALLVEVTSDPDVPGAAAEVFEMLERGGWTAYLLENGRLRRREAPDRAINWLFLQPRHLGAVEPLLDGR